MPQNDSMSLVCTLTVIHILSMTMLNELEVMAFHLAIGFEIIRMDQCAGVDTSGNEVVQGKVSRSHPLNDLSLLSDGQLPMQFHA